MVNQLTFTIFLTLILSNSFCWASQSKRKIDLDTENDKALIKAFVNSPVHDDIITTVFWIGERSKSKKWSSNLDSAWDRKWKENFGGLDSPILRNGFYPARFQPRQNPFYVALPFNDISNPQYFEDCPILKYFKCRKTPRSSSVCKNQWVEITLKDRVCYAQWQDVGPVFTDDYDYVFKGEEPRAHQKSMAGLDVSPAVRDFLTFQGHARTSWRFVDESEVPDGPWLDIVTRS